VPCVRVAVYGPVHFFPAILFLQLCLFCAIFLVKLQQHFSPHINGVIAAACVGDCVFAYLLFHQRMGCFNVVWLIQWYKVNHAWPLNGAWLALTRLHTRNRVRRIATECDASSRGESLLQRDQINAGIQEDINQFMRAFNRTFAQPWWSRWQHNRVDAAAAVGGLRRLAAGFSTCVPTERESQRHLLPPNTTTTTATVHTQEGLAPVTPTSYCCCACV